MKYYLLNTQQMKDDIWQNPMLIKTKSLSKIKKIRVLQKKLDVLLKNVRKDIFESNAAMTDSKFDQLLQGDNLDELDREDYNHLLAMCLYDTQEQRIRCCNKTTILKGNLIGTRIT